MKEYYIQVKELEKDLISKIKSIDRVIEEEKDKVHMIGTISDGGQFGFKMAYEWMLNSITSSHLMSHAKVLVTTEEVENDGKTEMLKTVSRTDVLYQLRNFARDFVDSSDDYRIVYEVIDAFIEKDTRGE